jgi:hypothetical protein
MTSRTLAFFAAGCFIGIGMTLVLWGLAALAKVAFT